MDEARTAGLILLERATSYFLGSLSMVTPEALPCPTPCSAWDLRALLQHVADSVAALGEAVVGTVDIDPPPMSCDARPDPVAALRDSSHRLLGAWTNATALQAVAIGGRLLPVGVVAGTGALEIAVHAWDIARACGSDHRLPAELAEELLELSHLIVTDADRPARFAPPVAVSPAAAPADRLVAFLGRTP